MLKFATALTAFMLIAAPARALELKPVDEAGKDPKLAELIATLSKACDEKNFKPFEEAISPEAMASFGGDTGVQGFKDAYGIDDPATTFYANFKAALALGGAFVDESTFGAPYVYVNWPEEVDSFGFVAAIGAKTAMVEKPAEGAKELDDVTHMVLEVIEDEPGTKDAAPEGWVHVKLAAKLGAKGGYVKASEVRSPIDYRAVFQKTENRWWLGAFVAGD